MLGVLFNRFPPYVLRQNLPLNLELVDLTRMIGRQATGVFLSPSSQPWLCSAGVGKANPCP